MAARMRVIVPSKGYDHRDPNAREELGNGWKGTMNDGTVVMLGPRALLSIIAAHEAGELRLDGPDIGEDGAGPD